jgi:hypothetical protein
LKEPIANAKERCSFHTKVSICLTKYSENLATAAKLMKELKNLEKDKKKMFDAQF